MSSRHADTPIKAVRTFGPPSDMLLMTPLKDMVCTSTSVGHPARDYRTVCHINGVLGTIHLAQWCLHADGSHGMGKQGQVGMLRNALEQSVLQSTDVV